MKAFLCISLCILMHFAISQVYIVQIDTVTHYTCKKEMTIENMVKTGKYDIIKVISDPSVIIIHLDMMMLFGQNGEREITDVIDKDKSIQIMYGESARLTIRKSINNEYIMVIEDMNPDGSKKDVYSFADVKFLDNELR